MERPSEESKKNSGASVLRKTFTTIGTSVLFAFALSESLFFYLLARGLRYPESIIVLMLVLSATFIITAKCFSIEIAILTFYVSIITVIFIVDWFFGSSANPSIIHDYFGVTYPSGLDIGSDFLLIGLLGGGIWMAFLSGAQNAINQLRKMPIKDIRFPLRSQISKLTEFFDKHPWFITLLMSVITLIIGLIIGGLGR
jgi:hypothetical protein